MFVTSCPGYYTGKLACGSPLSPQLLTMLAALRPNILSRAAAVQVRSDYPLGGKNRLLIYSVSPPDVTFLILVTFNKSPYPSDSPHCSAILC